MFRKQIRSKVKRVFESALKIKLGEQAELSLIDLTTRAVQNGAQEQAAFAMAAQELGYLSPDMEMERMEHGGLLSDQGISVDGTQAAIDDALANATVEDTDAFQLALVELQDEMQAAVTEPLDVEEPSGLDVLEPSGLDMEEPSGLEMLEPEL